MSGAPLVRITPSAAVYRYGTPTTSLAAAALRFPPGGWTISPIVPDNGNKEGWAITGDAAGRRLAIETLLSRHRIHPNPPPGAFPSLTAKNAHVRHLAFARPPPSGEFTDFTARYGALLEEDRLTFREQLAKYGEPAEVERIAGLLSIAHLLDLPGVSLSSGQTRRARIAAALLTRPGLLLLEDPMAGLDVRSRAEVSRVLGEINRDSVRTVLVLKGKGGSMPDWVTNVADVRNGEVWIGPREEWEARESTSSARIEAVEEPQEAPPARQGEGEPVVQLQDVSVSYGQGSRPVLKNVSWSIRPGERWHLQGANGSGKTTLLSLILGHHPRSFSLPASSLQLFAKPRRNIPTPILRTLIGHTSPEVFAAFPRGMGLSALEAVATGFEGIFSRRPLTSDQKYRAMYLLGRFADLLGGRTEELARKPFAYFTPPQQALLLFLRAIVGRAGLVILDEPSQGMDEVIWKRCCEVLEDEWKDVPEQAVVVVSHYEDEMPWSKGRGKVLKLDEGVASIS